MITVLILMLTCWGLLRLKGISIAKVLISSTVATICYVGIVALIASTFMQSLRNQSNH